MPYLSIFVCLLFVFFNGLLLIYYGFAFRVCAYMCFSSFFFFLSACLFCSILVCLLVFEKKESIKLRGYEGGEDLGGDEGGKTMVRMNCMKKKYFKKFSCGGYLGSPEVLRVQ